MNGTRTMTPAEAFDALRDKVAHGLSIRNIPGAIDRESDGEFQKVFGGYTGERDGPAGRGERFQYEHNVLDQSVAFPGRRVTVLATFAVIGLDDGRLLLKLTVFWRS